MLRAAEFIEPIEESEVEEDGIAFQEYDITSSPNDFNVRTIVDYIDSGIFKLPVFQRNYVWTINSASKFIESIIRGLPIPQIFLFEKGRNNYLVIDGQQRLMSIYFFVKMRFPVLEKRGALRKIFDEKGEIPEEVFADDNFFSKFDLKLPSKLPEAYNKLHGRNYETLADLQTTLDLRPIRCVFVKQNFPQDDDSSVLEIFNRLNTKGVNLTPQEIRISLYNSDFMGMVARSNADDRWRKLIAEPEPDLRMKDVEILLRGFAMLTRSAGYSPSMTRFLNKFADEMQGESNEEIELLQMLLSSFLDACADFPAGIFGTSSRKLNISVFESVFSAVCESGYADRTGHVSSVCELQINRLKEDPVFLDAARTKSTDTDKVHARLRRARELLLDRCNDDGD